MNERNHMVKQDINLLEYPLWFQKEGGKNWTDNHGYDYEALYRIPTKTDLVFLLYLLMQSQWNDWSETIEISRYRILKGCKLGTDKRWYRRLEDSLNRWKAVGVSFKDKFYDGVKYQTLHFGIIDTWGIIKESKKLTIRFSPEWLSLIRKSKYYEMIDFQVVKKLRSPLVTRLYEILLKSFHKRDVWQIGAVKLAAKIPMAEKYPSIIVRKIRAAVNRINNNTPLKISLTVRAPQRGKALLIFKKNTDEQIDTDSPQVLLALVPEQHRNKKTIRQLVLKCLKQHGPEYVKENILYTNEHLKDQRKYRVYLAKSLENDWGTGYTEDVESNEPAIKLEPGMTIVIGDVEYILDHALCIWRDGGCMPAGDIRKAIRNGRAVLKP